MLISKIQYTTPAQQLKKLREQHLTIDDEEFALSQLQTCGYSNLIKSYREPYIYRKDDNIYYRENVTFEQIYSLYLLDKNLRNAVMAAMQDLEENIKESVADVIADSFGTHHKQYLQFRNYRDKTKSKPQFRLNSILANMEHSLTSTKNPVAYYMHKYGTVPPWILLKSVYFSTTVNFIDKFKVNEQQKLANILYNSEKLNLPIDNIRKLLFDTLFICLEYRNASAHGSRIYNYIPKSNLRAVEIFNTNIFDNNIRFSQLLFLLKLLKYQLPYERLDKELTNEINRHCKQYEYDITYLGQTLNINITTNNEHIE